MSALTFPPAYKVGEERRVIETIQCTALTPHQLPVEGGGASHRDDQVLASPPHQLPVEESRGHRDYQGMRSPHTSYRWRGYDHRANQGMRSPHTSYRWRGRESHRANQCMRSPHTSYRWRGERVIETIKCDRSPTHQLQGWSRRESPRGQSSVCAHHTPATGGEERES